MHVAAVGCQEMNCRPMSTMRMPPVTEGGAPCKARRIATVSEEQVVCRTPSVSSQCDHVDLASKALVALDTPQFFADISGLTPCVATRYLRETMPMDAQGRLEWCRQAKIAAILGSCPKSRKSFASGIKHWISFAEQVLGGRNMAFPPSLEGILVWSHTFRCVGTFANYYGYLRSACLVLEIEPLPASHPAIHRAKTAIVKRMLWTSKPKMFLQRSLMRNMVLAVDRNLETQQFAMLWLVAYWFLLRVPSEALPMQKGSVDDPDSMNGQSVLFIETDKMVCLRLKSRKNSLSGTTLRRACSCEACKRTCPVHVLWYEFFDHMDAGEKPWFGVSANAAIMHLRNTLDELKVPESNCYGTHDFRRGHAKVCMHCCLFVVAACA